MDTRSRRMCAKRSKCLQKDDCLQVYDRECGGRNRRYYKLTPAGEAQLRLYSDEWKSYSRKISALFSGEELT